MIGWVVARLCCTKRVEPNARAAPLSPCRTKTMFSRGGPAGACQRACAPRNVPNSFKTKGKFGTDVIYQRAGKGKAKGLKLMYGMQASAPIPAKVPFHRDFETVMRREVVRAFGPRLRAAMATRRK